ncbi:MAG TPA: hypothetical protein VK213_10890 [Bacteroidales bacterium]|nr:hypothetical protein [Bacteroidales bacterium]
MKKFLLTPLLALLLTAGSALKAQNSADDYLGLPGDNLNLYAVMNLFQESQTLEEFERKLNDKDSKVNNLDLNGDNYVDYINVVDYPDGNVHTIVMQVAINRNEKQDVGVFTVERLNDGSVQIQLIGDEALYGRNYIIEPYYAETPNPGYTGKNRREVVNTTYIAIDAWPVVRYIYDPGYTIWRSSWYWGYYPAYFDPWEPYYYHYYYGYHYHLYDYYHMHYRVWDTPRYGHYHDHYYTSVRNYSPTIVVNINKGVYKTTYSKPESRRDGEALYSRERARSNTPDTRRSEVATTRRGSQSASGRSASQPAESRRAESSSTVSRSAGSRESASQRSSASQTRNTATRNASTGQTRDTETRSAGQTRSTGARSSSSGSTNARPASTGQTRNTEARPSPSNQSRSNETRASSTVQTRSTTARPSPSSQPRSSEARPSSSEQSRSTSARPASSGQTRNSDAASRPAARSGSSAAREPRQSSSQAAPKSSSQPKPERAAQDRSNSDESRSRR